jgi:hypothetical protein
MFAEPKQLAFAEKTARPNERIANFFAMVLIPIIGIVLIKTGEPVKSS